MPETSNGKKIQAYVDAFDLAVIGKNMTEVQRATKAVNTAEDMKIFGEAMGSDSELYGNFIQAVKGCKEKVGSRITFTAARMVFDEILKSAPSAQ